MADATSTQDTDTIVADLDEPEGVAEDAVLVVSEDALEKVLEVRDAEDDAAALCLRVEIIGVNGVDFTYDLGFEPIDGLAGEHRVYTQRDLTIAIPEGSVDRLLGAVLGLPANPAQGGLVIRNPNRPAAPVIDGLTNDDELSAEIEALVSGEVNPALAAHGGFVTYVGHDGDGTVYMTMGGGCHGCSMSKLTMLDGVQTMLSEQIPAVQRVKDLTDHATGENPYYS